MEQHQIVNSRLRILFLLQDPPFPVIDGMRWKMFYLLKYLSRTHQCDVLYFSSDPAHSIEACRKMLPGVRFIDALHVVAGWQRVVQVFSHLAMGLPPSFARYRGKGNYETFRKVVIAGDYDVIHYDIVNTAQYLRLAPDVPSVHSPNDATSLFYSRMAARERSLLQRLRLTISAMLLRRYERTTYARFSKVHVVSDTDAEYLSKLAPNADIKKIYFGIDGVATNLLKNNQQGPNHLVLVLGGANVPGIASGISDFLETGVPHLLARFGDIQFRFHGRDMESFLAGKLIAGQVEASNWVADLNDLIDKASVIVLPDKAGTGIKTRALQSMARGKPIVGTRVAFEGILGAVVNERDCLIAENTDELTSLLENLLEDGARRSSLGEHAIQCVSENFAWDKLIGEYDSLYRSAASGHGCGISQSGPS